MTFKTRLSVLLVSTPVLAFVLIGGLMGNHASARSGDEPFVHLRVFREVVSLVMSNYVEEVKVDKVMGGALRGLAEALDPDSAYLTAQQVQEVESGAAPPAGDIGIELTRQFYLRVIAARDGSPAAQAGLQTGDYIRTIDGKSTRDLSVFEGMRLLRGAPGSKVAVTIIRGNAAEPHELTIVRARSAAPPVTSKMLADNIGYVRIAAFTGATAADVKREAGALTKAGARALVLDIRRTAEGDIAHGIATARLFVKSGTLTSTAGRPPDGQKDAPRTPILAGAGDGAIELPVQLLTSAGTSSAAEVFAAALHGNKRADLVGEHTIGRAAVQKLVKLPEGRGLWLTYSKYFTPGGEPIHGAGLKPDVAVEEPDVEFGAPAPTSDPLLDAALKRARDGAEPKQPRP